ncbi:SEC14 [Symbiodinium microadriaticum]|nr:SEC14 [Symbiodinium microadriaticum]
MSKSIEELTVFFREEIGSDISTDLDDADCMRFLRARKMNIHHAADMARRWHTWWHQYLPENNSHLTPATILTEMDDPLEPLITELCPHALVGVDKAGHPIYWEQTGLISTRLGRLKHETTLQALVTRHIRLQEMLHVRRIFESKRTGRNIEKSTIVFDLKGVSMTPDFFGIEYMRKMLEIDQNFYPERLSHMVFINAPWFFSALYALFSAWIDPVTAEKIRVIKGDFLDQLTDLIDIDQIPEELGGGMKVPQWHWPYPAEGGASPDQLRLYVTEKQTASGNSAAEESGA